MTSVADAHAFFDAVQAHGHGELDTATMYTRSTSERFLGETDYRKRGLAVASKLYPLGVSFSGC